MKRLVLIVMFLSGCEENLDTQPVEAPMNREGRVEKPLLPVYQLKPGETWEDLWKKYDPQKGGLVDRQGRMQSMDCNNVEFLVEGQWYSRMDSWAVWKLMTRCPLRDLCKRWTDRKHIVVLGPNLEFLGHYPNPRPEEEEKFLNLLDKWQREK